MASHYNAQIQTCDAFTPDTQQHLKCHITDLVMEGTAPAIITAYLY